MLHVTSCHESLLYHHLIKSYPDQEIKVHKNTDNIGSVLIHKSFRDKTIDMIVMDKEPPNLKWSPYGTTYLRLNSISSSLKEFISSSEHIQHLDLRPELYKARLQEFKGIFESDAFEWFWNRFKNYPNKLNAELFLLIQLVKSSTKRVTLDDLLSRYNGGAADNFLNNFGNGEGTKLLQELDSGSLWTLFMDRGSAKASIDSKIDETILYPLEYVRSIIRLGIMDTRVALMLFNCWLEGVGVTKLRGIYSIKTSKQDLIKLESIYE